MTVSQPPFNASNSIIVRLKIDNKVGMLARVNRVISEMGGVVGAIDLVGPENGFLVRDFSIGRPELQGASGCQNRLK